MRKAVIAQMDRAGGFYPLNCSGSSPDSRAKGEMAERTIAAASKAAEPQGSLGSNPSLSAKYAISSTDRASVSKTERWGSESFMACQNVRVAEKLGRGLQSPVGGGGTRPALQEKIKERFLNMSDNINSFLMNLDMAIELLMIDSKTKWQEEISTLCDVYDCISQRVKDEG